MIAVFLYGKLGEVNGNVRNVYVERTSYDTKQNRSNTLDKFLLRDWSAKANAPLLKMEEGQNVAIKGRLVVEEGQTLIIAEQILGS